jgi:hypothetical protein
VTALPLKDEYRPSLAELLAPRWRRAGRLPRALLLCAALALLAAVAGLVATVWPPSFSRARAPAFSFRYRGLYRAAAPPGSYVQVRRGAGATLAGSFVVAPLTLPPYSGRPSAALALYASGFIQRLAAREPGFALRGEGWTQNDSISVYAVYNVFFRTRAAGRALYGRDVLLLPERAGARRGVVIEMRSPVGSRQVNSPLLVGAKGALEGPLKSFALG